MNAAELQELWPLLFTVEGTDIHFELLTSIPLLDTMKAAFENKTATLIGFLETSKKCGPVMKQIAEAKLQLRNDNPMTVGLLLALSAYFGENEDALVITKDVSSLYSVLFYILVGKFV
jgi:hypothetical protein